MLIPSQQKLVRLASHPILATDCHLTRLMCIPLGRSQSLLSFDSPAFSSVPRISNVASLTHWRFPQTATFSLQTPSCKVAGALRVIQSYCFLLLATGAVSPDSRAAQTNRHQKGTHKLCCPASLQEESTPKEAWTHGALQGQIDSRHPHRSPHYCTDLDFGSRFDQHTLAPPYRGVQTRPSHYLHSALRTPSPNPMEVLRALPFLACFLHFCLKLPLQQRAQMTRFLVRYSCFLPTSSLGL